MGQCNGSTLESSEEPETLKVVEEDKGIDELAAKQFQIDDKELCAKAPYARGQLSIVILGASGDLAKKKTYPSILDLYTHNFLPAHINVMGFARSKQSVDDFRTHLKPWLLKTQKEAAVDAFLKRCFYFQGTYDSAEDFARLDTELKKLEAFEGIPNPSVINRLFYFAIPPDAFLSSARSIKASAMGSGFTRLIVEKPFGHDLESALQLSSNLNAIFSENFIYRIDHYLGKEVIQNLLMFRFANRFLQPIFTREHIASVRITFKEDFGTEGRGGYFTNYGIIRDIIQNHLMQVLSVMAMEPPKIPQGQSDEGNSIRDAKVEVIKAIKPIKLEDVVIGQYIGKGDKPGYLDDDSIKDKEKAKIVPTFAVVVLYIENLRWSGVPFMIKAGKALDERKAEIRIQFKESLNAADVFSKNVQFARNELVMRMQPDEAIYMKSTVKSPGLQMEPMQTELDLTYRKRFHDAYNPDAYTRLILEALRGNQGNFVRSDEIEAAWRVFDPLLKKLEAPDGSNRIVSYPYGSRGPDEADELFRSKGFEHDENYHWEPDA